jgi:hypothetical protein
VVLRRPHPAGDGPAAAERLVEAGVLDAVPDELGCLPTDHAGIVAELRLPATGLAASEPPPAVWRSPIGLWGGLGLLLLALLVWRVVRDCAAVPSGARRPDRRRTHDGP